VTDEQTDGQTEDAFSAVPAGTAAERKNNAQFKSRAKVLRQLVEGRRRLHAEKNEK